MAYTDSSGLNFGNDGLGSSQADPGFDWGALFQNLAPVIGAVGGAVLGNKGNTSTQTQNNIPEWQRPYIQNGFTEAARLYGNGPQQYYPNSTVAPLSQVTTNAIGRSGGNPQTWDTIQNYLQGSMGTSPGAFNLPGQQGAIQSMLGGSRGNDPASSGYYSSVLGGGNQISGKNVSSGSYSAADSGEKGYAQKVMRGDFLNSNPFADRIASQIGDDVQARVGSQFASGGRSMSGAAARALAEQTGDSIANFRGGLYENERGRMTSASELANSISGRSDSANQFNIGNRLAADQFNSNQGFAGQQFNANQMANAAAGSQGAFQFGQNNQLNALNAANQFGARQDQANQFGRNYDLAAARGVGDANDQRRADNTQQMNAGNILDQYGQRNVDDAVNRFNFDQQSPWDQLQRYLQSVAGNGYGGTVTNRTQGDPLAGALGGAYVGSAFGGRRT